MRANQNLCIFAADCSGETSEQLKAICACIPVSKIWNILEMDARCE